VTRRAKKREQHVDIQGLTADGRLAFAVGRVMINALAKTAGKSFYKQIAEELAKTDGDIMSVNQLVSLPRLKRERKKS
jgi:hypothetical protein